MWKVLREVEEEIYELWEEGMCWGYGEENYCQGLLDMLLVDCVFDLDGDFIL